jgi:hypothetical protein
MEHQLFTNLHRCTCHTSQHALPSSSQDLWWWGAVSSSNFTKKKFPHTKSAVKGEDSLCVEKNFEEVFADRTCGPLYHGYSCVLCWCSCYTTTFHSLTKRRRVKRLAIRTPSGLCFWERSFIFPSFQTSHPTASPRCFAGGGSAFLLSISICIAPRAFFRVL